jgi:hypothetical protein
LVVKDFPFRAGVVGAIVLVFAILCGAGLRGLLILQAAAQPGRHRRVRVGECWPRPPRDGRLVYDAHVQPTQVGLLSGSALARARQVVGIILDRGGVAAEVCWGERPRCAALVSWRTSPLSGRADGDAWRRWFLAALLDVAKYRPGNQFDIVEPGRTPRSTPANKRFGPSRR